MKKIGIGYEFYKEFLLYLHQCNYRKARQLIADAAAITDTPKVQQAMRFAKTRLHFIAAHLIKEYKYQRELKQNKI